MSDWNNNTNIIDDIRAGVNKVNKAHGSNSKKGIVVLGSRYFDKVKELLKDDPNLKVVSSDEHI